MRVSSDASQSLSICLSLCAHKTIKYAFNINSPPRGQKVINQVINVCIVRTYWNSEYYSRSQDEHQYIFGCGWWTLANLNMIDRQLMSSGIVSLDAFFYNNTMGTVNLCEPYSFG